MLGRGGEERTVGGGLYHASRACVPALASPDLTVTYRWWFHSSCEEIGSATPETLSTSPRLKPERNEGPGEIVEEDLDTIRRLNPALLYAGDFSRASSKWMSSLSVDVQGSLCSRLREKILLAFEGHDEAASAGCILSILRRRRDMFRLDLSKSWMPVVKVLVDSSARSTEVLTVPFNDLCQFVIEDTGKFAYHVRMVNMRFSDVFDP